MNLGAAFAKRLRAALPVVARCSRCGRGYVSYPDLAKPCGFARDDDPRGVPCGGTVRTAIAQRCARRHGHAGDHLWIRSTLPAMVGECTAVPEDRS